MFSGIVIIAVTVATVLVVYFGARRLLRGDVESETRDLAASILFRVAALHGLVLALVFASEIVEYHQLGLESAMEANAISDVSYDMVRYGSGQVDAVRDALRRYLEVASTEEWESLGRDGVLHSQGWASWETAYQIILDLEPSNARQQALRDNMLDKIHAIAENRDLREYHARSGLSVLFWAAALVGVVLVAAGYYTFPPKRHNLILLTFFGAYTGFILFTIYAMSNPFSAPAALEPELFRDLLVELLPADG